MRIALTIAGSDSGGGARAVETVSEAMISAQLAALAEDLPPAALKTGMLAEASLVRLVGKVIRETGWSPLVVDPVMVSTSGHRLLTPEAEDVVRESLLPLAAVVTPNLDEAAILTGLAVHDEASMERAGETLLGFGAGAVLVKGGHLAGDEITDLLVTPAGTRAFRRRRIATTSTHGTGCTLSAAIAAGLALGRDLDGAVEDALDYVHRAIAAAPGLGGGHGPLDHTVPPPGR